MGKYIFLVGLRSSTAHTCHLFAWQWLELIWRLAQISQVREAKHNKRCLSSRPYSCKLSLCPVWKLPATFTKLYQTDLYCATLGKNCDIFLLELWWQVVLVWLWLMDKIDHLTASQTATKNLIIEWYWMILNGCQARQKTLNKLPIQHPHYEAINHLYFKVIFTTSWWIRTILPPALWMTAIIVGAQKIAWRAILMHVETSILDDSMVNIFVEACECCMLFAASPSLSHVWASIEPLWYVQHVCGSRFAKKIGSKKRYITGIHDAHSSTNPPPKTYCRAWHGNLIHGIDKWSVKGRIYIGPVESSVFVRNCTSCSCLVANDCDEVMKDVARPKQQSMAH